MGGIIRKQSNNERGDKESFFQSYSHILSSNARRRHHPHLIMFRMILGMRLWETKVHSIFASCDHTR